MISISSRGNCGEDDFRYLRSKEAKLPGGKAWGHQVEKSRYEMDKGSFQQPDKSLVIAVLKTFIFLNSSGKVILTLPYQIL